MASTTYARSAAALEFAAAPARKRQARPVEVCEISVPAFEAGEYIGHRPIHANANARYLAQAAAERARAAHEAAREVARAKFGRAAIRRPRAS